MIEVDFARLGLQERSDIQEWVAANPSILDDNLLIIGKEFSGFDRTNDRLDLLAVDIDGKLVVIELKRDDTGADAHWQAIKYASYLHHTTANQIVEMMSEQRRISLEDAEVQLQQHLGADDLNALNNDQRIILASHRFAPEVTSASLWLNEKSPGGNLITCIQLIPYHDPTTSSLYVQASRIIPVPGIEDFVIRVGNDSRQRSNQVGNNFGANLQAAFDRNKNDAVTVFLRNVADLATEGLPDEIRPDKTSRWGAGWANWRYYHLWYTREPWSNWGMSYRVNLWPGAETGTWTANVEFKHYRDDMAINIAGKQLHDDQIVDGEGIEIQIGTGTLNDEYRNKIAGIVRSFIEIFTPIVNDLDNEESESES